MKQNKMILTVLVILVCIACLFAGCAKQESTFQWNLHAAWVTADGEVNETLEFSLEGSFPKEYEINDPVVMDLKLDFPEGFPYLIQSTENGNYSGYVLQHRSDGSAPIFLMHTVVLENPTAVMHAAHFYICPEKECFVFYQNDEPDIYLVASTDPNADFAAILAYVLAS